MLNRISVNVLLKSVIATLAAALVAMLAIDAWSSWTRLAAVNRIAAVADTSAYLFTALHNMRVDRATTYRELLSDRVSPTLPQLLKSARDGDMPALKAALVALQGAEFPERDAAVAKLDQAIRSSRPCTRNRLPPWRSPKRLAAPISRRNTSITRIP